MTTNLTIFAKVVNGKEYKMDITGKSAKAATAHIPLSDTTKAAVKHKVTGSMITMSFNLDGKKERVTTLQLARCQGENGDSALSHLTP